MVWVAFKKSKTEFQAKEKQLKIVSALNEDDSDKKYFKNKIDYLIKEIDYCIERISL